MKKINLFSRNTDLPSYRRMPVSRGIVENRHTAEARCPGIAIAMTCPAGDFSSQGDEKHNVCDASFCIRKNWIPAFAGMTMIAIAALFATPSFAEPTELDKKTVASKAYVDTKQDMIPAAEEDYQSVLTDTDEDGVIGKRAILDWQTYDSNLSPVDLYSDPIVTNMIPEVKLVGEMTRTLGWISATYTPAINAYNTTFGNGTNNWAGSGSHLINGMFLANSLALKQNKLPAKATGNAAPKGNQVVVLSYTAGYPSNVYTTAGKDLALTAKSGAQKVMNYIDGTTASATFATSQGLTEAQVKSALVSLELLKDVYSALHNEIQNATPTGTPGNVAMYDASTGALGDGVATYDGSTTYNASTDADKIAVMSGVQRKKECGGYEPAPAGEPAHDGTHPGDEDYCWLWIFPD